jgi:predicted transposase YbfD/YdcC
VTHELWIDRAAGGYGHGAQGQGGGWPGLRQVVCVRTTREALDPDLEPIVDNRYYLTSLATDKPKGRPKALLTLARSHWEIENCLHHAKDRSLAEDADRTSQGACVMARLRSLAIGLFKHIAGHSIPQKQIRVVANPNIALTLLKRKRLARTRI